MSLTHMQTFSNNIPELFIPFWRQDIGLSNNVNIHMIMFGESSFNQDDFTEPFWQIFSVVNTFLENFIFNHFQYKIEDRLECMKCA